MEVRQCVYSSDFLVKINSLNSNADWRKIIGLPKADRRLKDRELVLRVISLYWGAESYEKPMKRFLNKCAIDFMERLKIKKDAANQDIVDIEQKFSQSCREIINSLGERPFHLRGRLNFGALDAVMVVLMKSGPIADLRDKYKKLLSDDTFQSDVSFNTSDESVLKRRFGTAAKYLA